MFNKITLSEIFLILALFCFVQCSQRTGDLGSETTPTIVQDTIEETSTEEVEPVDTTWLAAEANFMEYCTSCHGNEVNAFVDRKWEYGNTKEEIIMSIRDGIINEGMPAYDTTFTDLELDELAEYILIGIADRESYNNDKTETPKYYDTELLKLKVDTVVADLGIPWGIKVTSDGTIYLTEKAGFLKIKKPNQDIINVSGVPRVEEGIQGGLLDIALHPQFASNQWLYLAYSKSIGSNSTTVVTRARLDGDRLVEHLDVFQASPAIDSKYHWGCRIIFDNDGYLFLSIGDRGRRDDHPQSLSNSCGKIHRINDDGSIPDDNPFVNTPDAIKSIWSYGHRNPQGLIYNSLEDRIWDTEHGPRGGDELNLISKGVNYGWPVISYGINYNGTTFTTLTEKDGMEQPKLYWTPSIAPSGMALVEGSNYGPWEGDILAGSLRFDYVSRITVNGGMVTGEERVLKGIGRVRAIEMGQDGFLYVGVEEPGRILKVSVE